MLFSYVQYCIYLLQYCDHWDAASTVCDGSTRTVATFLSDCAFYLTHFGGFKVNILFIRCDKSHLTSQINLKC